MGAVALLMGAAPPTRAAMGSGLIGAGAVGTRPVAAPAGVTEVVIGRGTGEVAAWLWGIGIRHLLHRVRPRRPLLDRLRSQHFAFV